VKYIAIDASTEACSVALYLDGQVFSKFELCPQSHSVVLLPMIDALLQEHKVALTDLDGLIYGQGPGSFTGVRIGIGVAQGLAFGAGLQTVGVSTLQAMAQQAYEDEGQTNVFAAIDARMSEIYAGHYQLADNGLMTLNGDEVNVQPADVSSHLTGISSDCFMVGTGFDTYTEALQNFSISKTSPSILYPNAKAMLSIGIEKFKQGLEKPAEEAQPVYVRDTISWKKLPGRE